MNFHGDTRICLILALNGINNPYHIDPVMAVDAVLIIIMACSCIAAVLGGGFVCGWLARAVRRGGDEEKYEAKPNDENV